MQDLVAHLLQAQVQAGLLFDLFAFGDVLEKRGKLAATQRMGETGWLSAQERSP